MICCSCQCCSWKQAIWRVQRPVACAEVLGMENKHSHARPLRSWQPDHLLNIKHDGKALEALPMLFTFTPLEQEQQSHGVVGNFQQAGACLFNTGAPRTSLQIAKGRSATVWVTMYGLCITCLSIPLIV